MKKKLWGGRFAKKTDPLVEEFTRSIQYDYKLAPYDIIGSRAHIRILKRAGILTAPETARMDRALASLGAKPVSALADLAWGGLAVGATLPPGEALFPRRDLPPAPEEPTAAPSAADKPAKADKKKAAAPAAPPTEITFDDFLKVELVAATVLTAEAVAGSDKLLRLTVDLGGEGAPRQIVSGIAKHYAPAELVGRQVVVVKNLAPRTIFKLESHGMILAADAPDGKLALLQPSMAVAPGTRVS